MEKTVLPQKTVWVKPNYENPGWIKNPRHKAFFKLEGTADNFVWAQDRSGKYKNLFTDKEKAEIEKMLQMEPNTLSIYNKANPLRQQVVKVSKDPMKLDLNDPEDFIKYKILLSNSEKIAPSVKNIKDKGTYKYYIEDEDEVAELTNASANLDQRAWVAYGEFQKDWKKLATFVKMYNQVKNKPLKKFDTATKLETLQSLVVNIIKTDKAGFVELVENPSFDTLVLLSEAIEIGEIEKKQSSYFLKGGQDKLGSTLKDTISFLESPMNQELRLILEEKVKVNL